MKCLWKPHASSGHTGTISWSPICPCCGSSLLSEGESLLTDPQREPLCAFNPFQRLGVESQAQGGEGLVSRSPSSRGLGPASRLTCWPHPPRRAPAHLVLCFPNQSSPLGLTACLNTAFNFH